jgi:pre-mRNA cleavage complex 2 protein Pcf11
LERLPLSATHSARLHVTSNLHPSSPKLIHSLLPIMSLPAAEIAADFRDALQDLRMNSRPEISNLTLIAKENTEYAQAISTELENHIRTVSLDTLLTCPHLLIIVLQVTNTCQTRPEWKLPSLYVLDSIVKNVGTPYTVYLGRNLYRTFMDAYLVVDQATRKAMEGLLRTWKQPVPESMDTRPVFPANVTADIENAVNKIRSVAAQAQPPRPMHALPPRPPSNVAWRDTSTPPQNLPRYPAPNDPRRPAALPPTPQYGVPSPHPPAVWRDTSAAPQHTLEAFSNVNVPPRIALADQPPSVPILQPGGLQYLMANFPNFPPPPPAYPVPPPAAPAPPAVNPTVNLAALLAQLSNPGAIPPPLPQPVPTPINGASFSAQPMARQISAPTNILNDIELTTASMKVPRFHLISRLYEAKPNICATCGRRFESTPEGKEKKARHMDWHFKVKDPDAAKRGVHRSWYMSEKDWIDYREVDETTPATSAASTNSVAKPKKQAKDRYVLVPQDPALQHAPCPICQEKFDTQWNVDANDFIWMDALQVGGKIYHATCFEEYSKGAGIPMPSTPDSVLGKRKNNGGTGAEGKRVRAF